MEVNEISLSKNQVKPVIDLLNDYLANYQIHYQKLRGAHWNIEGENFLHCIWNLRSSRPMPRQLSMKLLKESWPWASILWVHIKITFNMPVSRKSIQLEWVTGWWLRKYSRIWPPWSNWNGKSWMLHPQRETRAPMTWLMPSCNSRKKVVGC